MQHFGGTNRFEMDPTSIKKALQLWQQDNPEFDLASAIDVQLQFRWPPIEKMDDNLSALVKCEKLSLSTNMIKRVVGLSQLRNLKILSLGRNQIRYVDGIESVAETLEQLWISYNMIAKLGGLGAMKKLKVLYIGNNLINDWSEVDELSKLKDTLENLTLGGNPIAVSMHIADYRKEIKKKLPFLHFLDGRPTVSD